MQIHVVGKNHVLSKEEIKYAAEWMFRKITKNRFSKNLFVVIKNIGGDETQHGRELLGSCVWVDDNIRPKEFVIELNATKCPRIQLQALGHELVHMKQYVRGELVSLLKSPSLNRWQGKTIDDRSMEYWELPWEIEAYGREAGLYVMYEEHRKNEGISFNRGKVPKKA